MSRSEAEVLELLRELCAGLQTAESAEDQPLFKGQKPEPYALTEWEIGAFPSMMDQAEGGKPLTPKQMEKVLEAADRLQLKVTGENLFSALPEARQAAERKRAAAVVLPWEKGLMARPLRPPGR